MPKKKIKKKSISQLKKEAWRLVSLFIRQRGADSRGFNTCVTCGVRKHYKELQAGHFIGGRHNAILFEPRAIHPQCYSCNVMKHGDQINYFRFMQRTYGDKVIEELEKLNRTTKQFTTNELERIITKYQVSH